eukprot:2815347-Amphidinium_carterae.1
MQPSFPNYCNTRADVRILSFEYHMRAGQTRVASWQLQNRKHLTLPGRNKSIPERDISRCLGRDLPKQTANQQPSERATDQQQTPATENRDQKQQPALEP